MLCCEIFLKVGGKNKMEELSSLGVDLLLIKLDGIRFLLQTIIVLLSGIFAFIFGFSIAYLFRKKGK